MVVGEAGCTCHCAPSGELLISFLPLALAGSAFSQESNKNWNEVTHPSVEELLRKINLGVPTIAETAVHPDRRLLPRGSLILQRDTAANAEGRDTRAGRC